MSNEPAFPTHDANNHHDSRERILTGGMTLRDYFAGQALAALPHMGASGLDDDGIAKQAYALADALLIERERGQ